MTSISFHSLACLSAAVVLCSALTGCHTPGGFSAGAVNGAQAAEVRGAVRVTDASKQWRPLRAGAAVGAGHLLQTAMESAADIIVAGGGSANARVLMQSDTVIAVQGLPSAAANELQLDLRLGWLTLTGTPGPESPLCEVRFPKGVAGARGATFNITAEGHVKVMAGTVVVKMLDDQPARTVAAGMQFNAQTGEISAAPAGNVMPQPAPPPAVQNSPVRLPNRPAANPFPWVERPR